MKRAYAAAHPDATPRPDTAEESWTPREQALARQLTAERARFAHILQQTPAFLAIVRGPDHVIEMANPAYYQLVGHREILGRAVREALPEVEAQGVVELLDRVYRSGRPFVANEMPIRLQRMPGAELEQRFLSLVYQPLVEADGSTSGVLAHGVDVTEQVLSRMRLAAAEAHYRRLVECAPQAIFVVDVRGRLLEINAAGAALLGEPVGALLDRPVTGFVEPGDLPVLADAGRRLLTEDPGVREFELRIRRSSGERRLLRVTGVAVRDGGTLVGAQGTAIDITSERESQERMRLHQKVLQSLEAGVCILDGRHRRFLFVNAACARMLGCSPDGAGDRAPDEFLPDQAARDQLLEITRALETAGHWRGRIWRRRTDGTSIPLDAVIGCVTDESGERLIFTIMQPADEAMEAERQLRRAERLASVGTLISGVAHELNNPLHAIRGLCELLLRSETSAERREDLSVVVQSAERMAKTISDLRLVVKQAQAENDQRERVDLNAVVHDVLRSREYWLSTHNVEVREELAEPLPAVWGSEGELRLVVENLLMNAVQATTGQRVAQPIVLRTVAAGARTTLEVADRGSGIPPEHQESIFDPFWTTRSPGEGTGLGLSLVHRIVSEHEGEIQVESRPGQGTTIRVRLWSVAREEAAVPEHTAPPAAARPLRVLVVDDEAASRRVITRALEQRGHRSDEADGGEAALGMLQGVDYDVIVSDLRMPGLAGDEFFKRLHDRGDGLERRLVLLTGDISEPRTARVFEEAGVPVLLKPIEVESLVLAIEARARASRVVPPPSMPTFPA